MTVDQLILFIYRYENIYPYMKYPYSGFEENFKYLADQGLIDYGDKNWKITDEGKKEIENILNSFKKNKE
ncbi:MAG: hypothetical protein AABY32_01165 [Nanoarchaeota archaeon]